MTPFEEYFTDKILTNRSDFWGSPIGTPAGQAVTGVTITNGSKTMTISSSVTGSGAYLSRGNFNTTIFPDRTGGDEVWFRLLISDMNLGVFQQNFAVSLFSGGTNVTPIASSIVSRTFSANPAFIEVIVPYTLQANTESMELRLTVRSDAQSGTNRTITWSELNAFNKTDGYTVAIDKVETGLRNSEYMYTFFERSSVMSKAVDNNSTDNAPRIQDEIDNAIQNGGELIFLQKNAIRVNAALTVNGPLAIKGKNTQFRISNPNPNKELFTITTSDRFECRSIAISPVDTNAQITSFRFTVANYDSIIDSVSFKDFLHTNTSALFLDNVNDFVLQNCKFLGGPTALAIGHVAPTNNVTVRRCRFESAFDGIYAKSANNLIIAENIFRIAPPLTHSNRNIILDLASGTHENVKICDNQLLSFIQYSVRIFTSNSGLLRNLAITGNYFKDLSGSGFSGPIRITGIDSTNLPAPLSIDGVLIQANQILNKQAACQINDVSNLNINGNNIIKTGTSSGVVAYALLRCPDPKVLSTDNLISGQSAT